MNTVGPLKTPAYASALTALPVNKTSLSFWKKWGYTAIYIQNFKLWEDSLKVIKYLLLPFIGIWGGQLWPIGWIRPTARFCQKSIVANTIIWVYSSRCCCLSCFYTPTAELNSCERLYGLQTLKFTIWHFTERVCWCLL